MKWCKIEDIFYHTHSFYSSGHCIEEILVAKQNYPARSPLCTRPGDETPGGNKKDMVIEEFGDY